MTKPTNGPLGARVLLAGSQIPQWTQTRLVHLQRSLLEDGRFDFLARVLLELPAIWLKLQRVGIHDSVSVQLQALRAFALGESTLDSRELTNSQLAPLTVVSQVHDWIIKRDKKCAWLNPDDGDVQAAQGLCLGFLFVAVLSTAQNELEFERGVANSVRLAAAIGSIVDSESMACLSKNRATAVSVRCKAPSDHASLDSALDLFPEAYVSCVYDVGAYTVTMPRHNLDAFTDHLKKDGIELCPIGLDGSYHHAKHRDAAQRLKRICAESIELQLPSAKSLRLPLRSTADTMVITSGRLHDTAIDTILCQRVHWFQTVKLTASAGSTFECPRLESIGPEPCIPPSLLSSCKGKTAVADGIAVVGMSCRFPKASSTEELWQLLCSGEVALGPLPPGRFNRDDMTREPHMKEFWGNFLDHPDKFDHRFFGISGREAKSMDPQQRLALQVAYEALESSGYCGLPPGQRELDMGCYLGVGPVDYEDNVASADATAFSATGTLRAFTSGRISHFFGWSGPSITFDTACSSSAVAIHTACKAGLLAILGGECAMALAGGVNVITSPIPYQNLAAASFLRPHGSSVAFDASASGYCRGEGAGLLVLKRYSAAVADGDAILGIISGSAINQNHHSNSITVADSPSQETLFQRALSLAQADANDISYVEAHGTGTPVGDPIEYESVRSTFGGPRRNEELFLGSIKDIIGHAEAASGVASLIKVLLMMRHQMIPKQAKFTTLSPRIKSTSADRITIPQETQPWAAHRLVALVNNGGAAGSNVSFVVRAHPPTASRQAADLHALPSYPVVLSAKSEVSLRAYMDRLKRYLTTAQLSIGDVSMELMRRQNPQLPCRMAFATSDICDLASKLNDTVAIVGEGAATQTRPRPIVLAFGGQTGQAPSVSRDVYQRCDNFRHHLDKCHEVCEALGLPVILPAIFEAKPADDIVHAHCLLLSLQYASAKSWIGSGLAVDTLVGHSFGQLTALCVADSLSLEDAFRLVSGRARLIRDSWGPDPGSMLSIECSADELETVVNRVQATPGCHLDVACFNGPRSFVVAGTAASIDKAMDSCHSFKTKKLQSSHGYHSYLADSVLDDLKRLTGTLTIRPPRIHIEFCSIDGHSSAFTTADAVAEHTRQPVHFSDAVRRIDARLGYSIWLEAGSSTPIIPMARRVLSGLGTEHTFIAMDLRGDDAVKNLANAACQLWNAGNGCQYWPFSRAKGPALSIPDFPLYQFEQVPHWISYDLATGSRPQMSMSSSGSDLVSMVNEDATVGEYMFAVGKSHVFYDLAVKGHAVCGQGMCPASLHLELAARCVKLASGDQSTRTDSCPHFENLTMSAPLAYATASGLFVRLQRTSPGVYDFTIYSAQVCAQTQDQGGKHTEHARGRVRLVHSQDAAGVARWQLLQKLAKQSRYQRISNAATSKGVSGSLVYQLFSSVVEYAPYYQGLQRVVALDNEAVGDVTVPSSHILCGSGDMSICDPIALDNFLQVAGIHVNCLTSRKESEVFVCTSVDEVMLSPSFANARDGKSRDWAVYSCYETLTRGHVTNDIFIYESDSRSLAAVILGADFRSVGFKGLRCTLERSRIAGMTKEVVPMHESDSGYQSPADASPIEASKDSSLFDKYSPSNIGDSSYSSANRPGKASVCAADVMLPLRDLLSSVIEMPLGDIKADSTLEYLGIDSLLVMEVVSEIKEKLGLTVDQAQLLECEDVLGLSRLIQSESGLEVEAIPVTTKSSDKAKNPAELVQQTELAQEPAKVWESLALVGSQSFAEVNPFYDQHATTTEFADFYKTCCPLQSRLVVAYVVNAFSNLGCKLDSLFEGAEVSIPYHERHQKLIPQLYKMLEEAGLVAHDGKILRRTAKLMSTDSVEDLHNTLLAFPRHASETKLLQVTASRLADCLSGSADPLVLLFQNATARSLLEDVYTNSPMFKTATLFLEQYLCSMLSHFEGSGREISIIELGAGTGGTTKQIVETLSKLDIKFSYTFTDLSSSLVAAARRSFSHLPFMRFKVFDIEKTPEEEWQGSMDIVISTNCIHATSNLVKSTTNIRNLLRPDGILCLVELTQNLYWFDLVFGLLDGWWLFSDGRQHALADEHRWDLCLKEAGFGWVRWSDSTSKESQLIRVIAASPSDLVSPGNHSVSEADPEKLRGHEHRQETLVFKQVDGLKLQADLYYPLEPVPDERPLPVALMIHGGGHIMLSRRDIRPRQVQILLNSGFLPISVDYRLCPEVTLPEGPMADVADALSWVRSVLPGVRLNRADVRVDPTRVVAVGWSTGGHLALSLGWTCIPRGIQPPQAVLAFYSPLDYEDAFWQKPNYPAGTDTGMAYDLTEIISQAVAEKPVASFAIPASEGVVGGWVSPNARSRLAQYMNTRGHSLHVLLGGLCRDSDAQRLPLPTESEIAAVSPLAQVRQGNYATPTFIIHPREDDLIPWQQAQRTWEALCERDVDSELRILEHVPHLFDMSNKMLQDDVVQSAIRDGYEFLSEHVGLARVGG
ncbi:Thiolase-like protein [Drechmeria coniospora]|uniref:Thiolase-like protein n=1 Tax=Drechmeria coniospora TaxID=98403 RepID=A0A151GW51_DRECN|nr:Thiolase-like protein [Drechmeria coniospora]KYK61324.1 Thiolase-like protein [Drechmeria coniospora]